MVTVVRTSLGENNCFAYGHRFWFTKLERLKTGEYAHSPIPRTVWHIDRTRLKFPKA